MLSGEAVSKCDSLAGTPLKPGLANDLSLVSLVRGVQATTAIEGNTLTADQVGGILDGTYEAPPSRSYQQREVENVIEAIGVIDSAIAEGQALTLDRKLICRFNGMVLDGVPLDDDDTVPGEVRSHSVTVGGGRYRGAPAEDCDYLLDRLCDWLNGHQFVGDTVEMDHVFTLFKAVFAHLYLAWIHPFGDGNGRTARLVEFLLLAQSGFVPLPAAHLLSNHYNDTRDEYYRQLDQASRSGGDTTHFVAYAIQGFVDGIRGQIEVVRAQQLHVAWVNYVHEVLSRLPQTKATSRQRRLVLAMSPDLYMKRDELEMANPAVARDYAHVGERTLPRDLNKLTKFGLAVKSPAGDGWRARQELMQAFLPITADLPAT